MAKKTSRKTLQQQLDDSRQLMSDIEKRRDSIKDQSTQLKEDQARFEKTVRDTTHSIKNSQAKRKSDQS